MCWGGGEEDTPELKEGYMKLRMSKSVWSTFIVHGVHSMVYIWA
jgi:hypothetical protein